MINSISGYTSFKPTFKQNIHPADVKYKYAIIKGIQEKFQFTPKLKDLDSIIGPFEFKDLLKKLKPQHFSLGKIAYGNTATIEDFENINSGLHCVNLHIHTKNSDGSMSIEDYLQQANSYGNKVKKLNNNNSLPYYISSITDHNNINGVQEVIARIAEEKGKYKNLKLVPGCEFMFLDNNNGFEYPAFEALGYCFNPYDKELQNSLSKFISINLIKKIKEFGGILSYAHPIRYCQGNGTNPQFINYLKKIGIDGIESNHQYLTFKTDKELLNMIDSIKKTALKNRFWETGGTDSHCNNIFHNKAQNFLDELI